MPEILDDAHSEFKAEVVDVDIEQWVKAAIANPVLYRDRQVTEIVLAAIGLTPKLSSRLVLKGGTAMALAFRSSRVTADVDFTADGDPARFPAMLVDELNAALPRAAIIIGYLDLVCRVQSVKKMPRPEHFENFDFPALRLRIGSARRGTSEGPRLHAGQSTRVLDVEISFRDQVYAFQEPNLMGAAVSVRAFTLHEIIAEKFRALLQQPGRNRYRRQDVYDIAHLIEHHHIDGHDRELILHTLREKCRTRNIEPTIGSIDNPEIARRAKADWSTMALELGSLPEFEACLASIRELYLSLPWDES